MLTVHARIEGRVQGVFFRDFTRNQARTLNLKGWVRNMPDGAVEAVFQGNRENIDKMIDWLHIGSPHSAVSAVHTDQLEEGEVYPDFQIRF